MLKKTLIAAALGTTFVLSGTASANIVMSGDFVQTQISDDGTLGDGGLDPGLVYDSTGTASFDPNFDYVAPGSPHESFAVRTDQGGLLSNNNNDGGSVSGSDEFSFTSLVDMSAGSTFDHHVRWMGTAKNGSMDIQHDYFFNDDDERVNIETVITAATDLTGVSFARAVDPDPDSRSFFTSSTNNQRGIDNNTDGDTTDPGDVPTTHFVGSLGSVSGSPLGLFADTAFIQNTGISLACCSTEDPLFYLAGGNAGDSSTGDHGIGIGFSIGDLLAGQSVSIAYAYVMGGSLATIDLPDRPTTGVPVPGALALLGLGLLGLRKRNAG